MRNDNYNSFSGDSYFSRLFRVLSAPFFWRFLGLVFCFRWRRLSAAGGEAAEGRRQRRAGGILRA
jgi:hypothetical protein